jgi:hypothetical protein
VVIAIGDERQPFAVGRPVQVAVLAAIEKQAPRLVLAITVVLALALCSERRRPDLALLDVRELPLCRQRRGVTCHHVDGFAVRQRDGPDAHLGLLGGGRRIGRQVIVGRPVRVMVAATHKHQRLARGRKRQLGDFLAVVRVEVRELAWFELRAIGHPDVARAAQVDHPGDVRAIPCRHQADGERIAQHLFKGEVCCRRRWRGMRG